MNQLCGVGRGGGGECVCLCVCVRGGGVGGENKDQRRRLKKHNNGGEASREGVKAMDASGPAKQANELSPDRRLHLHPPSGSPPLSASPTKLPLTFKFMGTKCNLNINGAMN